MRPETMNVDEARLFLSQYFDKPIEEVETQDLQELYDDTMIQSKEASYTGAHVELLRALNLELMSREDV